MLKYGKGHREKAGKGPLKNDVTEKIAIFEPLHSCRSLLLIYQTPFPRCYQPKSDKLFPDKLSPKVHSGFNIWTVKWKNNWSGLHLVN